MTGGARSDRADGTVFDGTMPYRSAEDLPRDFRGLIVAVSPEGVIGRDGTIPWRYRTDQRRFRRLTLGTTVVMGRATWESFGGKALAKRRNTTTSRWQPWSTLRWRRSPASLCS